MIDTPAARTPRTVTEADDGENGPGSAADRLVATNVGKRGSTGVSNSPLSPSGPAAMSAVPWAGGSSGAGMSGAKPPRHGTVSTFLPSETLPRTANATSSRHSRASQAGVQSH